MSELARALDAATTAVRAKTRVVPQVGLILGSGLGGWAERLTGFIPGKLLFALTRPGR